MRVNEETAAANTNTFHNIHDLWEELDEIDRAGEVKMSEMTGAGMVRLTATATCLTIV
jgi:hypothetical protein